MKGFILCLALLGCLAAVAYAQQSKPTGNFKLLAFISKKEGMTSEEFMNYYETRHAPFVLATLGAILSPCDLPISYSRNFAFKGQSSPFADFEYDVVTEFVFASRENYNNFLAAVIATPAIAADEREFINLNHLMMSEVQETYSDIDFVSQCVAECKATVKAIPRPNSWVANGKVWTVYDLSFNNTGAETITDLRFTLEGGNIESTWNIHNVEGTQWKADLFGSLKAGEVKVAQHGFISSAGPTTAATFDLTCN